MKIEKIKIIDDIKELNKYKKDKYIYFGNEFCEKKLFTLRDLKSIVSKNNNQKIILVFPYLTQKCLDYVKKIFEFINLHSDIFIEIVFNDWGLFYYIRNKYPKIKLVLGRLLTKQKTDPFAYEIIHSKQTISSSKNNVFISKKISKQAKEYFSQTLINSKIFQDFMLKNNIVRVEIDNVNWDMNIKLPKKIKVSLYYPYVKITTTRLCSYLNMIDSKDCKKHCKNFSIKLEKYRVPYNYIIKGNTVNYKNINLPTNNKLIQNNIDRIIVNE